MIIRKLWSPLAALVMVGVAAAIVWSWRDDLPDPVASHWSAHAAGPDGFQPVGGFVLITALMVAALSALFGAIGWFWGQSAVTRRMVAGACVWAGGFGASLLLLVLGAQRGLDDASEAAMPGWVTAAAIGVPLLPAFVAAVLTPGDRPAPATAPVASDAQRIALAGGERAVWIRRADGGPGLVVGAVVTVGVTLLAIALELWALLLLPVLLAGLFVAMFAFTVRVDASGLTVRSVIGWPGTHVPADEIERASVIEVHPLRQFGGWGWRVGRGGRVGVVLRSGEALLVDRTGSRSFVVTVDDAASGAALLNTLADRTRR